jgi:hypothetical protein
MAALAPWHLDDGFHLDQESAVELVGEFEFDGLTYYDIRPLLGSELTMSMELDVVVSQAISLDLLPLIPEKFRQFPILQAWIDECELQFGRSLFKLEGIIDLLDPNKASSTNYLRQLGALLGVKFPPQDESTVAEFRKILAQAVDWYKLKGSYQSANILSFLLSQTINLYDMYTDDYITFVLTDWFVGNEDENPPGLGSAYYKSPHFGLEIILDKVSIVGSQNYLWYSSDGDNLIEQIEETRPVHTVPHYFLLLNPQTDELGHLVESDGNIQAKVTSDWQFGTKYFDALGSGDAWQFDNGSMTFDFDETTFIKSITKWVLGTGNYPGGISSTATSVETPVLSGTIDLDDITIYDNYYEFEFIVPKSTVQAGITELGLYIPGVPDSLVVLSAFPKIDKTNGYELRVVVQVWKEDLSV